MAAGHRGPNRIDSGARRTSPARYRGPQTAQLLDALEIPTECLGRLQVVRTPFEDFAPTGVLDFIVSYDVLEHVNPASLFPHAFRLLRPGGRFVNVGEFTGHGPFYDLTRPLDFLTCPDWLWRPMFSAMETTNRGPLPVGRPIRHRLRIATARH